MLSLFFKKMWKDNLESNKYGYSVERKEYGEDRMKLKTESIWFIVLPLESCRYF